MQAITPLNPPVVLTPLNRSAPPSRTRQANVSAPGQGEVDRFGASAPAVYANANAPHDALLSVYARGACITLAENLWPPSVLQFVWLHKSNWLNISSSDLHALCDVHRDHKVSPDLSQDSLARLRLAAQYLGDAYVLRLLDGLRPQSGALRSSPRGATPRPPHEAILAPAPRSLKQQFQVQFAATTVAKRHPSLAAPQGLDQGTPLGEPLGPRYEALHVDCVKEMTAAQCARLGREAFAGMQPAYIPYPLRAQQLMEMTTRQLLELSALQDQRVRSALQMTEERERREGDFCEQKAAVRKENFEQCFILPIIYRLQQLCSYKDSSGKV